MPLRLWLHTDNQCCHLAPAHSLSSLFHFTFFRCIRYRMILFCWRQESLMTDRNTKAMVQTARISTRCFSNSPLHGYRMLVLMRHYTSCVRVCTCVFPSPGSAWHSCCCGSHWQLELREQLLQLAKRKHSCSSLRLHLDESDTDFRHTKGKRIHVSNNNAQNWIVISISCN